MDTATDITIEHYQRPEVKEIITRFTENEDCTWRALSWERLAIQKLLIL
jgi:hypothetical protein